MLRKLASLAMLVLFIGCNQDKTICEKWHIGCEKKYEPKFKAGDCYSYFVTCEKWQNDGSCRVYVSVVLEVGIAKYHTLYTNVANNKDGDGYGIYDEHIRSVDGSYRKTQCPKLLKEQYERYTKTIR